MKGIWPVKTAKWGAGVVIYPERGADLLMAQLMSLPLTVSCFSKIQIGFTFLVPAHPDVSGQRAVKRVCVCVCVRACVCACGLFIALHVTCRVVFVSVCTLDTLQNPVETPEPINTPFGREIRNHVLAGMHVGATWHIHFNDLCTLRSGDVALCQ